MDDDSQNGSSGKQQHDPKPPADVADLGKPHPVDVETQEKAAIERAENGGYD